MPDELDELPFDFEQRRAFVVVAAARVRAAVVSDVARPARFVRYRGDERYFISLPVSP
ncbi:hypothetical protein [Synergistes jonesii]|uniref:hypothetical protein n=1 Tax=Synergistes jonesii TaxID=2754 RepID=UPI00248DFC4F|nr:hypothetical protein [Synergistes jonesii]